MGIRVKIRKYGYYLKQILKSDWEVKKKIFEGIKTSKALYKLDTESYTDFKKLVKCAVCPNNCRFECSILEAARKETVAPSTKSRIALYLERGFVDINDLNYADVIYSCTNCNGCQVWCPKDFSVGDLLRDVRADLVSQGIFIPKIKEFHDNLLNEKTLFSKDTFTSNSLISINMENPEVLYFIGCVSAEKNINTVLATIDILKGAGIRFTTFTDKRECCGGPLFTLGFRDTFKEFAKKNLHSFKQIGIHTIICDCPMCSYTIGTLYKEVGLKNKLKVMTTSQYFQLLVEKGKVKPLKEVNMSITYHDPCYVSRRLEKNENYDSARYILSKIKGIQLKEAFLHGRETRCCGRGGVLKVHHQILSRRMTQKRLNDLKSTGADYIVSSCPSCELAFKEEIKNDIEVFDIAEIFLKSLEFKE